MAIRTFNSVGGFSVGEIPVNIISNVGEITGPGNANITGTVYACTALRTNSLLHLDGTPWDFQQPAGGADGQIQYYNNGDFGASASFTYTSSNSYFYVNGNANITGNTTGNNFTASNTVSAGNVVVSALTSGRLTFATTNGKLTDSSDLTFTSGNLGVTGNATISGNVEVANITVDSLTATRIPFASTGGKLVDSSALTFGSGNLGVTGNANISGNVSAANVTVSTLTEGKIVVAGAGGKLMDSTLSFGSGDFSVVGNVSASNVIVGTLTAGRVPYASTAGLLVDDSGLTYGSGNLTVSDSVSAANLLSSTLTTTRVVLVGTDGQLVDNSALAFTSGNLNLTGNLAASGNLSGNNATLGNTVSAANLKLSSLTSGRVLLTSTDGQLVDSSSLTFATGNLGLTGNIVASGNISGANESLTGNLSVTGNASVTGNVSGNNASFGGNLSVTGNVSGNNASFGGNASITGNISGNNETLTGNLDVTNITATGSITGADFYGSFHGSIVGDITAPGGSGANSYVVFNDAGKMNAVAGFSFDKSANALTVTGNLSAANISTGLITGTLTVASNAQPNITTVGTLLGVAVTGNANVTNTVNTGNLNVTAKVISSLIPSSGSTYDLGSSTLPWKNVYVGTNLFVGGTTAYLGASGNVIQTDAINAANNANVGSLTVRGNTTMQTDLTVNGNLTVGGSTTYVNVTNTSIQDPLIDLGGSGDGANATSYDGKDRGLILHNYDTVAGASINQAFIWKTADSEFQAYGNVAEYTDETVTGTFGNIRANVMFANLTGQVLTASQTNITTVGTLGNLEVSGNLKTANANITSTFKASGLTYPGTDGTNGQVITTDGSGNLSFVTIDTWRIQNTTSNVSVLSSGNVITYVGSSEKTRVSSGGLAVTGNLSVTVNTTLKHTTADDLDVVSFYPNGVASGTVTSIKSATLTTTSIAQQKIASIDALTARGVEFFVKGEDSDGAKYTVATVSAVHNGGSVDYAIYGTVNLPSSDTTGNLLVTLSGGNINLEVTPASSNTTVWTTQYRTI